MTIAPGDKIPAATLTSVSSDGPEKIDTDHLFAGKTVVLFGVPGAFTPTCTLNHLPGYLDNRETILAQGVDEIAVMAVNDHFVMKAWAEHTGGLDKIRFIADHDASFTKALGLDMDASGGGLGVRCKRFSMIVEDGKVKSLDIEDAPGEASVSGAAAMMQKLGA